MKITQRQLLLTSLFLIALTCLFGAIYAYWGDNGDPVESQFERLESGQTPQALRLTVHASGITAVKRSDIENHQLAIDNFSAAALRLSYKGQAVPFWIDENDETLYFYAQAITHTLEGPAVYWLEAGQGVGMAERNAQPSRPGVPVGERRYIWEENNSFQARALGGDVWLGANIWAGSSQELVLDNIQPTGGSAHFTIRLWSSNEAPVNPDHHVQLFLNGQLIVDHYWEGIRHEVITVALPPGALRPATTANVLTLTLPGDTGAPGEAIYLDSIELVYEGNLSMGQDGLYFRSNADNLVVAGADERTLIFDVTDPDQPVILTGVRYVDANLSFAGGGLDGNGLGGAYIALNPSQALTPDISLALAQEPLKNATRGAEYVVITPDEGGFVEAIQPLLAHRAQQGLTVDPVSLSQIYDEFAYGQQTPVAIREFLIYAVEHWQPAPRFVLLVGDATYGPHTFTPSRNQNFVPTYLVYTHYAGYVASDTYFSLITPDSLAPGLAIGRFPAQRASQVERMVAKTIAYEQQQAQTDWLDHVLLVADDEQSFNRVSDDLAGELENVGYAVNKLYMTENEDIRDTIISAFNQGAGIVNYVGHGSVRVWGDERVFEASDADLLSNGERLPIFTTFTCLNGYFNHPEDDALAETLLWANDGGVVAAVAPSGRSLTSQQLPLADAFFAYLLSGQATTLGEALMLAKIDKADDPDLADVIHTFNLLGDPALTFRLP